MAYAIVQEASNSSVSGVNALAAIAGAEAAAIASASQTVANPGVFTTAVQAFVAGTPVFLTGTAPGGFALNTVYWIIAAGLTTTACELSATNGGAGIQCTASAACTINPAPIQTAGNSQIAIAVQATGSTPTITDTAGNSYSSPLGFAELGTSLFAYVCQNIVTGPNIVTCHSNSANLSAVLTAEISGLKTSGGAVGIIGLGQNGPGAGTDSVTTGPMAINTVASLLYALSVDLTGSNVPVAGTGFTSLGSKFANYTGGVRAVSEHRRITINGNYAATFAPSVSGHTGDLFVSIAVALGEIGSISGGGAMTGTLTTTLAHAMTQLTTGLPI